MPRTTDPEFVRLATRLSGGCLADIVGPNNTYGSGWSISGLDVRKFPKDNATAARFVRRNLKSGKLEPASQAEWDEVHESEVEAEMLAQNPDFPRGGQTGMQEASLQRAAAKGHARLAEARAARDAEAEDDEDEEIVAPKKKAPAKKKAKGKGK